MKKIKGKTIPVRLPLPQKTGGLHQVKTNYNRLRDRKQAIREWRDHARE